MALATKAISVLAPITLFSFLALEPAPPQVSNNHKVGEIYLGAAKNSGKLKVTVRTQPNKGGSYTTTEVEIDVEAGDSGSQKATALKDALNADEGNHVHASQTEDADGQPSNHVHLEAGTVDGKGVTSISVNKDETRQKVVTDLTTVPNTNDSGDFDGDSSDVMPPEPESVALVEFIGLPTGYSVVGGEIGSHVEVGTDRATANIEILPGDDQSVVIRKVRAELSEIGIAVRLVGPDLLQLILDPDLDDYLVVDIDDSGMSLGTSIFDPADLN